MLFKIILFRKKRIDRMLYDHMYLPVGTQNMFGRMSKEETTVAASRVGN